MTTPQDPQFYAHLRGTIVRNGARIVAIEVRANADANGAGGTTVHSVEELKNRPPDEILDEIKEAIDQDAQHWPGLVRYQIVAVDANGATLGGRMVYEKRGRGKTPESYEPDEEASGKGVTSQHMRFTEGMFKTYTGSMVTMLDILGRALADERQQSARLMGEHLKVMAYGEDLLDRRAERDLWVRREQKQDALKEKAFDALFQFAPALLGGVAQGTRLEEPMKQIAQGSAASRLAESFKKDPARFGKILSCFSDEEKVGLFAGDFGPVLAAIERAGKVVQGTADESDFAVAARLQPLQELLTQEEKVVVMQLAEAAKNKDTIPAPQPARDIEVKEVKPSNVVPIDAKKGA